MVFSFTGVFVWSRPQKLSSISIEIFLQNRKYIVSIAMIVKSYDAKRNQNIWKVLNTPVKKTWKCSSFLRCAICRAYAVIKTFD